MLDLASGRGRHARAVAAAGLPCVALDRNAAALRELRTADGRVLAVRADLERGDGIPLREASFGAVLVFRYLHRPLCPRIASLLRPGGRLIYETFTREQLRFGTGPRNPDFLLEPGELPELFPRLHVEHFEEIVSNGSALARLVGRAPGPSPAPG